MISNVTTLEAITGGEAGLLAAGDGAAAPAGGGATTAAADGAAYRAKFSGRYSHRILTGIGHNVPQEAPQDFATAVVDADRL